jgi:hypothetical protein
LLTWTIASSFDTCPPALPRVDNSIKTLVSWQYCKKNDCLAQNHASLRIQEFHDHFFLNLSKFEIDIYNHLDCSSCLLGCLNKLEMLQKVGKYHKRCEYFFEKSYPITEKLSYYSYPSHAAIRHFLN